LPFFIPFLRNTVSRNRFSKSSGNIISILPIFYLKSHNTLITLYGFPQKQVGRIEQLRQEQIAAKEDEGSTEPKKGFVKFSVDESSCQKSVDTTTIREHEGLNGKTPAEACGITVEGKTNG
jgi:hypothetical protein